MIKSKRKLAFESGLVINEGENKQLDLTTLSARDFRKVQTYASDKTLEGEGLHEAISSELFKRSELGDRILHDDAPAFVPPAVEHAPVHLTSKGLPDGAPVVEPTVETAHSADADHSRAENSKFFSRGNKSTDRKP